MAAIDWTSSVSPTTQFQTFFNLTSTSTASGNGSWTVTVTLRAYNQGNTSSFNGNYGYQMCRYGGTAGATTASGTEALRKEGTPFLASGFANGAQRWDVATNIVINANANGYWSGTSTSIPFQQHISSTSFTNIQSSTLTLPRITFVPDAPATPTSSARTDTSVTLNWTAPARNGNTAITGYTLDRATNSTFTSGLTSVALGNVLTYTATGLTANTTYYWRVRATNAVGTGANSGTLTRGTITVPGQPPQPAFTKTATTINLTLTDPTYVGDGITARAGQLSTSSAFSTILATSSSSAPTFTNNAHGITRATQYYYRWRAQNAAGFGAYSDPVSILTDSEVPSAPTGYAASDVTSRTAYTTMPSVADTGGGSLTDLRIEYNTTASATGATTLTVGGYRPAFISGLALGTTYHYRMAVFNPGTGSGWSAYGSWVSFTTATNTPDAPGTPTAAGITNSTASVSWTAPASLNGSTQTGYTLRVARDPSFSTGLQTFTVGATDLSQAVTGLSSGTLHYAQVWATSTNGPGAFSQVGTFTTSGASATPKPLWLKVGGVWKQGTLWLKVGGVWKQGTLWHRVGGVWKTGA